MNVQRLATVLGAIVAILLAVAVPASAAWTTPGSGSVAAKAGQLTAPTPTLTATCVGPSNQTATIRISWAVPVNVTRVDLQYATNASFNGATAVQSAVSPYSFTLANVKNNPTTVYAHLLSRHDNWQTSYGTTGSVTTTC